MFARFNKQILIFSCLALVVLLYNWTIEQEASTLTTLKEEFVKSDNLSASSVVVAWTVPPEETTYAVTNVQYQSQVLEMLFNMCIESMCKCF